MVDKIGTVNFTGASGNKYPFDVYPDGTTFSDHGAVYVMSARTTRDGRGQHTPKYIGQSEQLGTRLSNHEKWPSARRHGANVICVCWEADTEMRFDIETDLRGNYNTPCNDQ